MEFVLPILSGAVVEVAGCVDLGDDASRVAGEHVDLVATTTGEVLSRHQSTTAIRGCVALNLRLEQCLGGHDEQSKAPSLCSCGFAPGVKCF